LLRAARPGTPPGGGPCCAHPGAYPPALRRLGNAIRPALDSALDSLVACTWATWTWTWGLGLVACWGGWGRSGSGGGGQWPVVGVGVGVKLYALRGNGVGPVPGGWRWRVQGTAGGLECGVRGWPSSAFASAHPIAPTQPRRPLRPSTSAVAGKKSEMHEIRDAAALGGCGVAGANAGPPW
jgi:hypothetical protein